MVHSLYAESRSFLFGAVGNTCAVFITAWKTGHLGIVFCALAIFILGVTRCIDAYLYHTKPSQRLDEENARRFEHRYTLGAVATAAFLGIWCFIALAYTGDDVAALIAMSCTLANLAGVPGRNFAFNRLVVGQVLVMSVPTIAGLILQGDGYHLFLSFMILPFFLAAKSIADRQRNTLLEAIWGEKEVSLIAQRFNTALNNMPHGLCMFDDKGVLLVSNSVVDDLLFDANQKELETTARDLVLFLVKSERLQSDDAADILSMLEGKGKSYDQKLKITLDGERILEFAFQPMDGGGTVMVFEDVTDRVRAEEKIQFMARFDSLTGLPNRMSFQNKMEEALAKSPGADEMAVLVVDIDGFKQVNDTLGHPVGDDLLCTVAAELSEITHPAYFASRIGGDEFMVLMPNLRCREEACALASMIIDRIAQPHLAKGHQIFVGASIGIAFNTGEESNSESILKHADLALYRAKDDGRGHWRIYESEMGHKLEHRLRLESELRQALVQDGLHVHYQPLVTIDGHKIETCEALVRWPHPELGPVSPGEFIPIAEEMGLINELGDFVLLQACREACAWPSDTRVAVNLSAHQFRRGDVVNSVENALDLSGLQPHRLELEITESAIVEDLEDAKTILNRLRDLGVYISLDDFGTGYSSLSYLHSLPLHKVKVDRSFIMDIETNEQSLLLLQNVARLSTDLGLSIVVEGVETEGQLEIIAREVPQCQVQGFVFSGALPGKDVQTMLDISLPGKRRFEPKENAAAG
ncbi:MAG: EAL domain-containing protein [Pseudomonadota bacterium]